MIVDDEEPARDLLINYAQKVNNLVIVDAVNNALDAKKIIDKGNIDILLTDIQMDDLTGIDLLKTLKNPPITIFTTAYSEYALEGYQLDVIDYLVKPISFQRFYKAIEKAIELCEFMRESKKNDTAKTETISKPIVQDFFFVKTNRKIVKVAYDDLLFVKSFGEYVKLYTQNDVLLALQTTNFMEELLPSENFIRIHRSSIININHITEIEGNMIKIGQNCLTISKRMREAFMKLISRKKII